MNYQEALEYIHSTLKFGSVLGLDSIKRLCEYLGSPQKKLRFIHVAGTNGKGSTCAMLSQILIEAGYKTGLYTSPYVEVFNERIRVNEQLILDDELASCTKTVKQAIEKMVEDGFTHPTEFEIVTAIAFVHFLNANCDYVVLETGLGGRLDATNVIDEPSLAIITSIDYDHMEWLGDTITKITTEKCGIIKGDCPVVSYPNQSEECFSAIKNFTNNLHIPKKPDIISSDLSGSTFDYDDLKALKITLIGKHQIFNATTAIEAAKILNIPPQFIREGLKNTLWGSRFEVISTTPLFIVDAAHNISGMLSFKNAVTEFLSDKKKIFIMGMFKDKEHKKCAELIAPLANSIITVDTDNPRALKASILADEARPFCEDTVAAPSIKDAVLKALEKSDDETAICAFGSFFLLNDIKRSLSKTF